MSSSERWWRPKDLGHVLTVVEAGQHELVLRRWGRISKPIVPAEGSLNAFQLGVGDFVVPERMVSDSGRYNTGVMIMAVRRVQRNDWVTPFEPGHEIYHAPEVQLANIYEEGFDLLETPRFEADVIEAWRDKNPPRRRCSIKGSATPWFLPLECVLDLRLQMRSPRTGVLELTIAEEHREHFGDSISVNVNAGRLIDELKANFGETAKAPSADAELGESEGPAIDEN